MTNRDQNKTQDPKATPSDHNNTDRGQKQQSQQQTNNPQQPGQTREQPGQQGQSQTDKPRQPGQGNVEKKPEPGRSGSQQTGNK